MRTLGCGSIRPLPSRLLNAVVALIAVVAALGATPAASVPPPGSSFFAVSPCRVLDTRLPAGPQGGPALGPNELRLFPISGICGVPLTATAAGGNLIAVKPAASGLLRVFPGDLAEPVTNTIAFGAGQTRAGNGLFMLATDGSGTLAVRNLSSGPVDVVFDATGYFDTGCPPIVVGPSTLPSVADGTPVSTTLTASGGIGPFAFAVTSGALPAGVTLNSGGVLSGTATASGSFNFTATATDFNNCSGSRSYTLLVTCPTITVSPSILSPGAVGVPYTSVNFSQTGAVGAVMWSFTGALPTGMTLSIAGVLSGTPTQAGTFPITVKATDAGGCSGMVNLTLSTCPTVTVANPASAAATAGSPFSQTFTQAGGAPPVAFSLASGTLPAGLTLAAGGTLSGTPTQTGTFPITVRATDANGCTGTGSVYPLVVSCGTVTVTNPGITGGAANTPFSQTFTQAGGIGAVTFSLASGTLPTGLTLAANGTLAGTPTQTGSFPITVKATDANTCNGTGATYTLVIACQVITVTKPAVSAGTVGVPFSQTFTQTNAIGTATFTTASTLPAGVSLATNGTLSGTPTQPGSFPITVKVTDSNGCTGTSALYTLAIACQAIAVTNPGTATGTAGTAFSQAFTQAGAAGSSTFTTASALPTGLTLSTGGVLSGTPMQSGTFPVTVTVTDTNGCTGKGATYTLVVSCQTFSVGPASLFQGTTGVAFPSVTFTQSGGIGAVTFTNTGALPTGLNFTGGVLSGTPTQTGSFPITVTATDANGCTASRDYLVVVACSGTSITLSPGSLPTVISGNAFPSTTFTPSGGTGPYTFAKAGALPAGMSFSVDTLSGTPTQTGTFPITVSATDAGSCAGSQDYVITVTCNGVTITVAPSSLSSASVGTAYTAVPFTASGGASPYTFTEVGGLPSGMTFSINRLFGTPTQAGTFPITVTATDAGGCTGATAYTLVAVCPTISLTNPSTAAGTVDAAFSQTFTQTGAVGAATFTTTSTLPSGMSLSSAGVLSGPPGQPGTFPIVVKVTDSNGCTGTSATYTLVISCQTITVSNPGVTTGTVDAAFSQTFTQTGVGTHTPVTFTTSSTLPGGLTLSSAGVLSGTPGQSGPFPIMVVAMDANGCTGTGATYTLVVACQTITVTNPVVTAGVYNTAFSQTFTQAGVGTHTPAVFSLASGTLPTGVSLTSGGVLTGAPTQTGTFTITVKATDANGCFGTSGSYVLTVAPTAPAQAYTGAGNTQFFVTGAAGAPATPAVSTGSSLLNGVLPAGATVTAASCSSGGTLTSVDTSGRFIFAPNLSATSGTCTYTVSSNTGGTPTAATAMASLTFTLNGMVWYVNNASGSDSAARGRSHEPLLTIAQAVTNASASQTIFLHTGSSAYAGTTLNKSGLTLWGQGTTFTLAPLTIAPGAKPLVNSTLTLAANALTVSSLDVSTGSSTGVTNTGSITGATVQNGVTVTTTTGTAVSLSSAGGSFTFQAVSANGGARGIFLTSTTGSFTVTGNGGNCTTLDTTCSGGTLQNMTGGDDSSASPAGTAVVLNNAQAVSLTRVRIRGNSNYGVRGTTVSGFTLDNSLVDGVNGTNGATPFNDGSLSFDNLTGSASISNTNIQGGFYNNFRLVNTTGTLNRITFTNVTFDVSGSNPANDALTLEAQSSAIVNVSVVNSFFKSAAGDLFQLNNIGTGACDLIFTGNTLTNAHPAIATGGGGVTIGSNGTGDITYAISTSTFRDAVGHAILLVKSTGPATVSGTFDSNTIGVAGVPNSGSLEGDGMKVQNAGQGTVKISITNSQIRQYNNFGIDLLTGGGASAQSGVLSATITGNTIANPGTNAGTAGIPKNGIQVNGGTVPGDTYQICLGISGNTMAGSGLDSVPPSGLGNIDFRLRQRQATTMRLVGYAGANNDNAAAVAYVQSNNVGSPTGLASNTVPTGGGFTGGAGACP